MTDENGVVGHAEMELEGARIMLATPSPEYRGPRRHAEECEQARRWLDNPWVVDGLFVEVDDVAAHHERAVAGGAKVLREPEEPGIGFRIYTAEDLGGPPLDVRRADLRTEDAARRWRETWAQGWREHDAAAIGELYADDAFFLSHPFREPENPRAYVERVLGEEEATPEVWFGEPVTSGDRAAVEYWATIQVAGEERTLAGVSFLRFDGDGLVVEHRDVWAEADGARRRASGDR